MVGLKVPERFASLGVRSPECVAVVAEEDYAAGERENPTAGRTRAGLWKLPCYLTGVNVERAQKFLWAIRGRLPARAAVEASAGFPLRLALGENATAFERTDVQKSG